MLNTINFIIKLLNLEVVKLNVIHILTLHNSNTIKKPTTYNYLTAS